MNYYATVDAQNYITAIYSAYEDFPGDAVPLAASEYERIQSSWHDPTCFKLAAGLAALDNTRANAETCKAKINETKVLAGKKIVTILPEWKQRNLAIRRSELVEKKADGMTLTPGEIAELSANKAKWNPVDAIREASDRIEAEIMSAVDPAQYDVQNNPLWP